MFHIFAKAFIVFVVMTYSVLAIPLIVWALNPQLGLAMMRGMMSAFRRLRRQVHSIISCVRYAAPLEGRNHGSQLSETRAHR
jgi:hypothetical protein